MTPAKIYPFSIPAGGSFPLLVIGDYAKILTSSGPLTLQGDTFGSIGPILAGQGVQDAPFQRRVLNDRSGATNNGTILIADQAFIDDRITGSVEVIDGGKNRTLSNASFMGVLTADGLAANLTHVALQNPTGSGKNVILKAYKMAMSTNDVVFGGYITTPLTTDVGTIRSKLAAGANSTARNTWQKNPTALFADRMEQASVALNTTFSVQLQEPLVITPGNSFCFYGNTPAASISVAVEFNEEAIL